MLLLNTSCPFNSISVLEVNPALQQQFRVAVPVKLWGFSQSLSAAAAAAAGGMWVV